MVFTREKQAAGARRSLWSRLFRRGKAAPSDEAGATAAPADEPAIAYPKAAE
jgi:multidrug efflux pump